MIKHDVMHIVKMNCVMVGFFPFNFSWLHYRNKSITSIHFSHTFYKS